MVTSIGTFFSCALNLPPFEIFGLAQYFLNFYIFFIFFLFLFLQNIELWSYIELLFVQQTAKSLHLSFFVYFQIWMLFLYFLILLLALRGMTSHRCFTHFFEIFKMITFKTEKLFRFSVLSIGPTSIIQRDISFQPCFLLFFLFLFAFAFNISICNLFYVDICIFKAISSISSQYGILLAQPINNQILLWRLSYYILPHKLIIPTCFWSECLIYTIPHIIIYILLINSIIFGWRTMNF